MKKLICAAVAAVNLAACGTITKGSTDTLKILSNPPQAQVEIIDLTGKFSPVGCQTPCAIKLDREQPYSITVSKPGFETQHVNVRPEISADGVASFAGNAVIGGIIGGGIDLATGTLNDLEPNPLRIQLQPEGQYSVTPAAGYSHAPIAYHSPGY